jgi:hypothetical protein
MPLQSDPNAPPQAPGAAGLITLQFLKDNPAWTFFPLNEPAAAATAPAKKPKGRR